MTKTSTENARILLLNPPTAAVSTEVLLNLAYLAASLRKEGHEVKIIDATAPHKPVTSNEIKRIVAEFEPHFIGVTLTITYLPQTYLYLKGLRKAGIPIVAGGPHANCLPEEVLENGADIVAIGEGEETIVELADYFLGKRELSKINGICYRDGNGKFFYTPRRSLIENIDLIPFPDFSDFPIKNYTGSSNVNSNPIFWSLFTSRGCPFDCTFCSSHNVFGRTVRTRSARNIYDEINGLVERFGVEKITFQDDEILCSKKRFLELCELILDVGLKIKMSIRTRIDSIDEDILEKAKLVGLTRISFGIESWNDDTLTKINKKYEVDTIHKKFKVIEKTNFPYVSFNNIIGFPWESTEHLQRNIQEISKIPKGIAYFTTVVTPIPYPKTALYDQYHQQFGFTDWWLNPKNQPQIITDRKPFFMYFAPGIHPIHTDNNFWNYSKKQRREIMTFKWTVFGLFLRRHFNIFQYMVIILGCRVSYFLWKSSPAAEQFVFWPLCGKRILNLSQRVSFITKY